MEVGYKMNDIYEKLKTLSNFIEEVMKRLNLYIGED